MKALIAKAAMLAAAAIIMASCQGPASSQQQESPSPAPNGFKIKRGTNVSHWLSQSQERGAERQNHIQEDDFARLDSLGFDHVRIPIDEEQFWDEQGNKLPEAWALLGNALDWARKYNLRAIVDLHIIRAHYFNAANEGASNTLFSDSTAQQGLINMWYQLSDFLKGRSVDWVAYEFMNEPVADEHEQWNALVAKVHKALREREPRRTLVIGSNKWQGHWTFKFLKVPEGDKNIILSFHYYNPQLLTHYGAWWVPTHSYSGKVNYPGVLVSQDDYNQAPDSIKPLLDEYAKTAWDRNMIHEQMKDAIEVAAKYGLQLFCGEWGVFEPVDRQLAYAWTRDMLSVFSEYNIAWTTWCYDADFGFWDQKRHCFKDKQLAMLLTGGAASKAQSEN